MDRARRELARLEHDPGLVLGVGLLVEHGRQLEPGVALVALEYEQAVAERLLRMRGRAADERVELLERGSVLVDRAQQDELVEEAAQRHALDALRGEPALDLVGVTAVEPEVVAAHGAAAAVPHLIGPQPARVDVRAPEDLRDLFGDPQRLVGLVVVGLGDRLEQRVDGLVVGARREEYALPRRRVRQKPAGQVLGQLVEAVQQDALGLRGLRGLWGLRGALLPGGLQLEEGGVGLGWQGIRRLLAGVLEGLHRGPARGPIRGRQGVLRVGELEYAADAGEPMRELEGALELGVGWRGRELRGPTDEPQDGVVGALRAVVVGEQVDLGLGPLAVPVVLGGVERVEGEGLLAARGERAGELEESGERVARVERDAPRGVPGVVAVEAAVELGLELGVGDERPGHLEGQHVGVAAGPAIEGAKVEDSLGGGAGVEGRHGRIDVMVRTCGAGSKQLLVLPTAALPCSSCVARARGVPAYASVSRPRVRCRPASFTSPG